MDVSLDKEVGLPITVWKSSEPDRIPLGGGLRSPSHHVFLVKIVTCSPLKDTTIKTRIGSVL